MARKKQSRRHKSTGISGKKASGKPVSGKKRAGPKTKSGRGKKGTGAGAEATAALRVHALYLLKWTHATTIKLAEGLSDQHALYQSVPTDNHLLWTFGHMATAYSWFASLIDGKAAEIPENYGKVFYADKPTGDAGAYPSLAVVRAESEKAFARLVDAITNLSDADAMKPPAIDAHGFATSRLDAAYKASWHEGWHQGQLSTLRRALGIKGVF